MIKNIKQFVLAGSLAVLSANVMALPTIDGTLKMSGGFSALDATGAKLTDATTATAIDFDFFGSNFFGVISGSGAFAGLDGQMGDITDFTFASFSSPIVDFWSVDKFSFELTSVARDISDDPSKFVRLSGEGVLSATGYEDTVANWSFAGSGSGSTTFSWSAGTTESVPEPGVLALLSVGLIGFGLRKKVKINKYIKS